MNTTVLRKVMMLVFLLAGYVFVMGPTCDPTVYCEGKAENTPCPLSETATALNGICEGGLCTSGGGEPGSNKCGGKQEHEACTITDGITGVCVSLQNILRCLVIVEIDSVPDDEIVVPAPSGPCAGLSPGDDCNTANGDAGQCSDSGACIAP